MFRTAPLLASATAVGALTLALAAPSGADTSTLNLTVTGGALTIDAPDTVDGSGSLGTTPQLSVTGIAVDDDRGSLAGWTATVTASDLTTGGGDDPGETIPAAAMTWTTTAITPNEGQAAITLPASGNLGASTTAAVGLPLTSAGSFTIDGRVDVSIPNTNLVGSYTGTLTTSIS